MREGGEGVNNKTVCFSLYGGINVTAGYSFKISARKAKFYNPLIRKVKFIKYSTTGTFKTALLVLNSLRRKH